MFTAREIKESLLGCLEVGLFMRRGIERFKGDWNTMLRSVCVPLLLIPFSFVMLAYMQPAIPELANASYQTLAGLFFLKMLVTIAIGLGLLVVFAKIYDRMGYVYQTITVGNWTSLVSTLLTLPLLFSLVMGWHSWEDIYPIIVVFAIYTYVYSAFVLTFSLRIPWEMAGFLSIVGMAVDQTGIDIIYWFVQ